MLSAAAFDLIAVPISDLYEKYTQSVMNDIARRLAKMKMTSSAAWQMQRLTESGMVYTTAINQLAKMTGMGRVELRELFKQAGVQALKFDDSIYKEAGLNPLPLNLSPAMLDVLIAGMEKTGNIMQNLTLTTALDASDKFQNAADLAYMQVSNGAMSYDEAIRLAIKEVASKGLNVIDYASGRKDQLDVAMRRTVLTGVAQTTNRLSLDRANEMGVDLVQTSAHAGARPEHEEWQGQIFSLSGRDPNYEDFTDATGYGEADGLGGVNCRHSFYPYFEGISENAYTQQQLDDMADEKVEYNNKELSLYEGTQVQRGIERDIRKNKREAEALGSAGLDNTAEIAKVRELQATMRDFIDQTGLDRQRVREGGRVEKVVAPPLPPAPPPPLPSSSSSASTPSSPITSPSSTGSVPSVPSIPLPAGHAPTPTWVKDVSVVRPNIVDPNVSYIRAMQDVGIYDLPALDAKLDRWANDAANMSLPAQTPLEERNRLGLVEVFKDKYHEKLIYRDSNKEILGAVSYEKLVGGDTIRFAEFGAVGKNTRESLMNEMINVAKDRSVNLEFMSQGKVSELMLLDKGFQLRPGTNGLWEWKISNNVAPVVRVEDTKGIELTPSTNPHHKGAFASERVMIRGEGEGILKLNVDKSSWGDLDVHQGFAKREVAAYEIDKLLGLNIVPKTVSFVEKNEYKSLQSFVPNSKVASEIMHDVGNTIKGSTHIWNRLDDKSEVGKMMLLDMMSANQDRHYGNWLVADKHLVAIDNGLAYLRTMPDVHNYNTEFDMADKVNKAGQYYLPDMYKDNLQKAWDSGELKNILDSMTTEDPTKTASLIEAGEKRIEDILLNWDKYFTGVLTW
jgi:hypothetical protein